MSDQDNIFQTMIDTIPGYVSWMKSDLSYLGVNQAMADTFNVPIEDFVGKKLGTINTDDLSFPARAKRFFSGDKEVDAFEVMLEVEGKVHWQLVQARKYKEGTEAIFVGIDITEKKRMEEQLEELQQQRVKDAKMTLLGELAANIAHEIKSPLFIIKGLAETLSVTQAQDENTKRFLGKINKTADRITKTINSLNAYSRNSEADEKELSSLDEVVTDSLELCKDAIFRSKVKLSVDKIPEDVQIECRSVEISQVLINLVKNSIDAISSQSKPWVRIEYQEVDDKVLIRIVDSGPGIPEEIQARLTDPFFTTKKKGKGTGIGLSLSRNIIQKHNGKLHLDTDCDNTCFVIELPKGRKANNTLAA